MASGSILQVYADKGAGLGHGYMFGFIARALSSHFAAVYNTLHIMNFFCVL